MPTLVLMRHAKSDWSADTSDLLRPIGARGRRQAAEAGEWLAGELPPIELALVSPAVRARTTWELAAEAFSASPRTAVDERLWTTDQRDILAVIRGIPDGTGSALVVSHDPAISAAASRLAAEPLELVTSCLAVLELDGPWRHLAAAGLVAFGRPPARVR